MIRPSLTTGGSFLLVFLAAASQFACASVGPKPVIFDTDICDDIDDTWALGVLLQSPELDCKLITTAVRDTEAKAKVVAKFLQDRKSTRLNSSHGYISY